MSENDDLDTPLWGAEAIGREAGIFDAHGSVDLRRTFYLLEKKLLPAMKVGRVWASTPRRLREFFAGEARNGAE